MTVTKGKEAKPGEEGAEEPDDVAGVFNIRRLAKVVFKYDPNSLIHGVFLEKIAGRLRLVRLLSAFIEAQGAKPVASGGVKFDRVNPKGDTAVGYGNVPFARTEFVAEAITAYFHVDLAQMAAYGLSDEARALLAALALWKIQAFLDSKELRLRTACILETRKGPHVTRPEGLALPGLAELTQEVKRLIVRCQPYFASPAVTHLTWTADEKKGGKKK
jgi:CRISPR-associated protein Csb1